MFLKLSFKYTKGLFKVYISGPGVLDSFERSNQAGIGFLQTFI